MRLYEISQKIRNCIKFDDETVVDEETGEMIDIDALKNLEMEFEEKVINIGRWIKELRSDADALKKEKLRLEKRQNVAKNKAESLEKYLESILNGKGVEDSTVKIGFRKSNELLVDMEKFLKWDNYSKYVKVADPEPRKNDIKKLIKSGETVPGCAIVEKNNIQIG